MNKMKFLPKINTNIRNKDKIKKTGINYQEFDINYKQLPNLKFNKKNNLPPLELCGLGSYKKKIKTYLSSTLINPENDINLITECLSLIIKEFMNKTNKNSALIHLRTQLPIKNELYNYKIPRWHQDGRYSPFMKKLQYKLTTNIFGKPTRIHPWKKKYIELFKKYKLKIYKENKDKLNQFKNQKNFNELSWRKEMIKERKKIHSILNKQVNRTTNSAYSTVYGEHSTIHSEPHINGNRLFMAVLPCSKEDMEWKRTYRRKNNKN